MTDLNKLMELKKEKLKKNPHFLPRKSGLIKRISTSWRRPIGIHNKIRKCKRGKGALVRIGYSTPKLLKGMTRDMKMPVSVSTAKDLDNLTKDNVIVFSSSLGNKKKLVIAKLAKEKNIALFSYDNHDTVINSIEENMSTRKKNRNSKKSRIKYKELKASKDDKSTKKSEKTEKTESKDEKVDKETERKEVEKKLIQKGAN